MSHHIELKAYLEDQRDDGQSKGDGAFTIEHQRAARKMAKFALPRRSAWVCKLVQAAVGWSVKALTVNQGEVYTVFHFEWSDLKKLPTETDVVKTIVSGLIGDTSPMATLCTGLRALVEQAKLSFLVVLQDGSLKPQPVYAGTYFSELTESARLSPAFGNRPGMTVTVAHIPSNAGRQSSTDRAYHQLLIAQELNTYCFMSPVPITLDGRRVDGAVRSPGFQSIETFKPLYTGGISGEPAMPLPIEFQERRMSLLTYPRRVIRPYSEPGKFQAALLLGCKPTSAQPNARGRSWLNWVRQGVIVDSKRIPESTRALTCGLYLNGDDLPTDLTGFKIAEQEDAIERETSHVRALGQLLSQLPLDKMAFAEDRDSSSEEDDRHFQGEQERSRIKVVLKGGGAGLGLAFFSPVLGTIVTLSSIAKTYLGTKKGRTQKILEMSNSLEKVLLADQRELSRELQNWRSNQVSSIET